MILRKYLPFVFIKEFKKKLSKTTRVKSPVYSVLHDEVSTCDAKIPRKAQNACQFLIFVQDVTLSFPFFVHIRTVFKPVVFEKRIYKRKKAATRAWNATRPMAA